MREPLYQVVVEDEDGNALPVGPKMAKDHAERFHMAISMKIAEGKEKVWSNPHLVRAQIA